MARADRDGVVGAAGAGAAVASICRASPSTTTSGTFQSSNWGMSSTLKIKTRLGRKVQRTTTPEASRLKPTANAKNTAETSHDDDAAGAAADAIGSTMAKAAIRAAINGANALSATLLRASR